MKKILIIIYIIIFQTFANADDISEFSIEGISVGEYLLWKKTFAKKNRSKFAYI